MTPVPLFHRPWAVCLTILLALCSLLVPLAFPNSPAADGRLLDSDGYMWLLRAERLHETGSWFDATVPLINAPYGEANHWSRPFDVILLAGAYLFQPFTDTFRDGLLGAAMVVCPLLLVVTIAVFSWGSRPILKDGHLVLVGLLLLMVFQFGLSFQFGRADHHALYMLLLIGHIGVLIRFIHGGSLRLATAGGVLSGLALWVGVEALATIVFFAGAAGVLAVLRGRGYLRFLSRYTGTATIATAAALFIQVPPSLLLEPNSTRISIYHVALLGFGWIALRGARLYPNARATPGTRLGLLAGAGGVALVLMLAIFPGFFEGPLKDFDEDVVAPWLTRIAEFQPLWPSDLAELSGTIGYLAPVLVGIVYAGVRWRSAGTAERDTLLILGLGAVLFVGLSLTAVRWSMYSGAVSLYLWPITVAGVASTLLSLWPNRRSALTVLGRTGLAAFGVLAVTLGPTVLAATLSHAADPARKPAGGRDCDWRGLATALGRAAEEGSLPPDAVILTYTFEGPEIAWHSGLGVIGAPYGNATALVDVATVLSATDDETARDVVDRRGVDVIVVCGNDGESDWYSGGEKGAVTLIDRLLTAEPPPWLRPADLDIRDEQFQSYRTRG